MLQQLPVSQVAKQVGEQDTRLWRLISLYGEQALAKQDFRNMKNFMAMFYFVCGELALPKAAVM